MPENTFRISADGSISLRLGDIRLTGIVPHVNGRPVCTVSVETGEDYVRYAAADGSIKLSLSKSEEELILGTEVYGFAGVHDIEPVGHAILTGADTVYAQGFGMEGPSGLYRIGKAAARSHGIAGLCGGASAAAAYAVDHTRYALQFMVRKEELLYSEEAVLTAGFSLECCRADGERLVLPELHFISGREVTDCMERAARDIAGRMDARTHMEPGYHWCSWYYHYENLTQETLSEFLDGIKDDDTSFNYIQIDAGYTYHIGDWLSHNHRYPDGLSGAADLIIKAGFGAGIWIAPFMVGDQSELYREHPDWVLHNSDGTPYVRFRSYTEPKIWGNTDNDYYVLDMTHPDACAYIRMVFESLRSWGFTLYKTDFMLWGMQDSSEVVRYDRTRTSVMVMRDTLAVIRSAIGEDSYLLGSIAPFMPSIGYADGMRIASDMGAQWTDGAFGPYNLLQELPYDNYFNNIFWQNDPDAVILRDFGTHLTDEETWSLAILQAVSGGIITTSDPVEKLPEERRGLLRFIRPDGRVRAKFPYLTEQREEMVITHNLHDWDLLFVLNPSDHPKRVHLRGDELFGAEALFQYRYDRKDGGNVASERNTCFDAVLGSHESALVFFTKEPLTEKPENLWHR